MVLAVLVFSEGWLMGNPTLSGLSASNNFSPLSSHGPEEMFKKKVV